MNMFIAAGGVFDTNMPHDKVISIVESALNKDNLGIQVSFDYKVNDNIVELIFDRPLDYYVTGDFIMDTDIRILTGWPQYIFNGYSEECMFNCIIPYHKNWYVAIDEIVNAYKVIMAKIAKEKVKELDFKITNEQFVIKIVSFL